MASEKIVGIDLGTTNSVVAIHEGGETRVLVNRDGSRLTPSVVGFLKNGDRLVGQAAKRQAVTNPKNTIFSIKRFMGRRHGEVAQEEKMVPYTVTGGPSDLVKVKVSDKEYTPPEISAMILQSLKETAEAALATKITKAVITVPAYFNDSQRQATKDAGKIAGLEVMRIVNEPTAAALAYGLGKKNLNEKVAVFDLGGGTFDISILEIGDGVFEVKGVNGDTHLGGDDFDEVLIHHLADQFRKESGIDLRKDQMALQRLKEAAEKAKCELSSQMSTDVNLPFITADASGPKHLQMAVTRAKFEQLIDKLLDRLRGPCQQALKDAGLTPADVDQVIMVGGSTRVPAVLAVARELFKKEPNLTVNPDEVVGAGAAVQASVLAGEQTDIVLLDVTPLTLGIETAGGVMTPLVERNTTIPCERKQVFTTVAPSQPSVEIHVLQGERSRAIDNRTLGRFSLSELPPAPAGVPQIEVAFNIDANGILNVAAKDLGTKKEQKITITHSSGLSEKEIERMRSEAKDHEDEDRRYRETADTKVECDRLVYQTEKFLSDYGDRLSTDDQEHINKAMADVKEARKGDDTSAMRAAIDALNKANQRFAEELYKSQQPPSGPGDAGAGPGAGAGQDASTGGGPRGGGRKSKGKGEGEPGEVIDAEFEVKD